MGIQAAAALLQNANIKGFFTGRISENAAKGVCVPGLNCYSCPGAVGACPMGALQSFLGARPFRIPYYVVGLLVFFGALLGRAVCGFLCPIGWLQELLDLVPTRKRNRFRLDRPLRKLKYLVLAASVILPFFVARTPFFCKYVCPSGTAAVGSAGSTGADGSGASTACADGSALCAGACSGTLAGAALPHPASSTKMSSSGRSLFIEYASLLFLIVPTQRSGKSSRLRR